MQVSTPKKSRTTSRTKKQKPAKEVLSTLDPDKIALKTRSPLEPQFAYLWADRNPEIELLHNQPLGLIDIDGSKRRYTGDFIHIPTLTLIEIQGGIYKRGRTGHSSIKGVQRDCNKFSLAALRGWTVFMIEPKMIHADWVEAIGDCIRRRSGIDSKMPPKQNFRGIEESTAVILAQAS